MDGLGPPDLQLAICLADIADSITLDIWSPDGVSSTTKADVSRATEVDIAAEHAVRARIMETRPDDGFRGEELGEVVGTTGQRWTVDWMDGTGFFVAGQFTSPRFRVVAARHSEGAAGRGPEPTALVGRWPGRGIRRRRSITIWRCQGKAPLMSAIR